MTRATENAGVTIRVYEPGDERALLAAFNASFAAVDERFQARSLAEWRWRFLDNPHGTRIVLAVDEDGNVLAQYAGSPRAAVVEGKRTSICQAVDSFSAARSGLGHRSLFVRTCDAFIAAFRATDQLMWGVPVRSAWRIGQRTLGYALMQPVWCFELVEPPRAADGAGIELEAREDFPEEFDALFERVRVGRPAICVRDAATLDWRYRQRPDVSYRVVCARSAGELVGACVVKAGEFDGVAGTLICDWLVPADEAGVQRVLVEALYEDARAASALPLRTACAIDSPEWGGFQELGFRVRTTSYIMAGRSFERAHSVQWYARSFDWTLGDTDLV